MISTILLTRCLCNRLCSLRGFCHSQLLETGLQGYRGSSKAINLVTHCTRRFLYINLREKQIKQVDKYDVSRYQFKQNIESLDSSGLKKIVFEAIQFQVRDVDLWRRVSKRIEALLPRHMDPTHLAFLLNAFKRMHVMDRQLFMASQEAVLLRIDEFSLQSLSLLIVSYAALDYTEDYFFHSIADNICQRKYLPSERSESKNTFLTWANLVCGFGRAKIPREDLFDIASTSLCTSLEDPKLSSSVPHRLIVQVACSYCGFGYRHVHLLGLISKCLPNLRLDDEDVQLLQKAFENVQYSNTTLNAIMKLRFGY
ncbi:hypothetical protein IE077_000378 [Cardiosporidium cionae]|uniref:FAST kinase leucine-rich domain-containing protein n=1 Tax=Cardiosporidium cionae TaxID=476202 RepID=A0ABQ7JAI1_9APIC|nr:hypothetical protein IE077_000378 [Cardiosporidium cionae]|eukprot:KAF8820953.1 hypothetical protein IE077_000378 [Cardiosporidium cionae]